MKKTIIIILITTAITSVCWDVAMGLRRGKDKLWLMSAVTVPGQMALDEISSDLENGDYLAVRMKIEMFRKLWMKFDLENSFSSQALGNIMVEFSKFHHISETNGIPNQVPEDTARKLADPQH